MANYFKSRYLLLNRQLIDASGNALYINNVELTAGVSGNIGLTGQALLNTIASTGQAAWNHGQNNALNLSGRLFQTGSILDTFIDALSGNLILSGQIAQNNALNLSGSIFNTGAAIANVSGGLDARIRATGQASVNYADIRVAATGLASINYTDAKVALTGQAAWAHGQNNALNLSGSINASGRRAWDDAINLSGRLFQSGSILDTFIDAVSGNLTLTGQGARNNALNLSGALAQTGSILLGLINTASVSAANAVYTTGVQFISGVKYFLQPIYADTLYVTGSQFIVNTQDLYVGDNWIVLNATGGARDSAIFISTGLTGLNATGAIFGFDVPSNSWRFGMGSQQTDLLSLPRLASGEDIDSLNTRLIQSGYGLSMHILTLSGNINASGRRAWDDAINLSGRLFATGSLIAGVSGGLQAQITSNDSDIAGLITNLTLTGQHGTNNALNLSGRLALTGSILDTFIDALSGNLNTTGQNAWNNTLNLSGNINSSGRRAWDDAINLSGRLAATGSDLNNKIIELSGVLNVVNGNALWVTGSQIISGNKILGSGIDLTVPRYSSLNLRSGILDMEYGTLFSQNIGTFGFQIVLGRNYYYDYDVNSGRYLKTDIKRGGAGALTLGTLDGSLTWNYNGGPSSSGAPVTGGLTTKFSYDTGAGFKVFDRFLAYNFFSGSASVNLADLFYATTNPSGYASSGVLAQTGQSNYLLTIGGDTNLSGRLFATGSTLDNKINSLSGYLPYMRELSHPITANYSIVANNGRIYCNNTIPITVTFPSAVLNSGQVVKVKLINTGSVIFTGTFGQKFDGSDSYLANGQYNAYEAHTDGANWYLW